MNKIVTPVIAVTEDPKTYELSIHAVRHVDRGDGDWKLYLDTEHETPATHLFQVVLADDSVHYVLAASDKDAISQATCFPGRSFDDQRKLEQGARAFQLPLMIRGWSGHRF